MAEFPYEFTPMSKEEYMGHSELEVHCYDL